MNDPEPVMRVRWQAPKLPTWRTYLFHHGIAFDLKPFMNRSLSETLNAASIIWGTEIPAGSHLSFRLKRALGDLRIEMYGSFAISPTWAAHPLKTGVTA